MTELKGRVVTVAGAGALGLVAALRLVEAGARVALCDPAPLGANASGVAAGMLAPVFESVLDRGAEGHFDRLVAARELWPALASRIGLEANLDRSGAVLAAFADERDPLDRAEAQILSLGVACERLSGPALRRLHPALAGDVAEGLMVREDWRLHPAAALAALRRAFLAAGGCIVAAPLKAGEGRFTLDGRAVEDAVVIAAGAAPAGLTAAAPDLAALAPVKGQILAFAEGPEAGPVVRSLHGYVAPQPGGVLAGASMEAGRDDLDLDARVLAGLRASAARLFPHLADAPAEGRAGVRATTPDGLPLVGRARTGSGLAVVLATGARRNGWLLAPLVAEEVTRALAGAGADPAFDPARFG